MCECHTCVGVYLGSNPGQNRYHDVYASGNYFLLNGGEKNDIIWLYYWSGDSIKETAYQSTKFSPTKTNKIFLGSDYFVITKEDDVAAWVIWWNGTNWIEQELEEPPASGEKYIEAFTGPEFFALRGGNASVYDKFRLYRKLNKQINFVSDSIWVKDIDWEHLKNEGGTDVGDEFSVVAGANSFAVTTNGKSSNDKMYRWIYRYDGSKWKMIYQSTAVNRPFSDKIKHSLCATSGGYGFVTLAYYPQIVNGFPIVNFAPEQLNIEFVHKFQDNFNAIKSYVVSRKDVISLSTAETLTTVFNYNDTTCYFDAYIGSLKFNQVSVITENTGKTTNYFYNDGKFYTARPDYKELDGISYKTETRNENNQLLSGQMSYHKLFRENHWPSDIFEKRSDTTISCQNGVYDTTCNMDYKYGTPSKTAKIMNNHKTIVNATIFAHEVDTAMKNRYMLNQQCASYAYEKAKGEMLLIPQADDYRSSQVTLWRKQAPYGFMAPCSSFVWNAVCDTSGRPVPGQFSGYNFNMSPSFNMRYNWEYNGSVKKYDRHGNPVEKEDKSGKLSSVINGTSREIPIGSADNCSYQELAIFTCDYKRGSSVNWWDSLQGWQKYTNALLVNDSIHFGQKAVKFTQRYAVRRDNLIIPGKSYIMSAWVKVNTGLVLMKTDFHRSTINDRDAWPLRALQLDDSLGTITDSLDTAKCAGNWKLMKIEIPASLTSRMGAGYDWYARAWIGEPDNLTGSVVAYVDDVRFYPKDAHVSTTYYDTLYYQPIITVDENNNPGTLVKYDLQGRPEQWYKINKNRPSQKTSVMKKDYHLFSQP